MLLTRLFPRLYEGWIVVGCIAVMVTMVGASFFYGFGLIFTPIREEFGWSNATVSLAFSLRTEAGGIAAPLVGMGIDRVGPRRILVAGILLMAGGVFLLSLTQSLWQFYALMILIAVGTSAAGGQVGMVATATWFERRRGRAMSVMTVGGGLAGMLVVGMAALVEAAGWRGALRWLAAIVVIVGLPLALNIRNRPVGHPQPMDGIAHRNDAPGGRSRGSMWGVPPRVALRSRSFILIATTTTLLGFGTTAIIVHVVPFLESLGMSSSRAGLMVGIFTLTSVAGRLGFGFLADKYEKRLMLAMAIVLTLAGMLILSFATSAWIAILGLLVVAPGFGGSIPVRPALIADYFGTRYFGTLNGLLFLISSIGSFFGPLVLGAIIDATDRYTLGWLATTICTAIALPTLLAARAPRALQERHRFDPAEAPAA